MLLNVNRENIRKKFDIPNSLYIDSVIALGYKSEKAIIEDMTDSIKYYRDKNEILHVPKEN